MWYVGVCLFDCIWEFVIKEWRGFRFVWVFIFVGGERIFFLGFGVFGFGN